MPNLIYIINLTAFAVLTIYFPIYISKKLNLPFWNPITISMFILIPVELFRTYLGPAYLLDNGLLNKYYNYAILTSNIELMCKYFITTKLISFFYKHQGYILKLQQTHFHWEVKRSRMFLLSALTLCLFFFFMYIVASHSIGLAAWIKSPRLGYQFHRTGVGQYYALAVLSISVSYALLLLYIKNKKNIYISFLVYLCIAFLLGSKGVLLAIAIYTFIILWYHNLNHFGRKIVLSLPVCFIPLLINYNSFQIEDILSYFDYYVNSAMYYEAYFTHQINLFHGDIALSHLWGIVPRSIYPDKPYVYGFTLVTEYFFPGAAEATHTPAFGGPIASFADFGMFGVVLLSIFDLGLWIKIFSYFIIFLQKDITSLRRNPLIVYLFILTFAPEFLLYLLFPLSFILFLLVAKTISVFNRISIRNN